MLIREWMSSPAVTIDPDETMPKAVSLMKDKGMRLLPVLKHGRLVGVVSETDIKRASPSDATLLEIHELLYLLARIKVQDIMNKNPVTIPENFTVEEGAERLLEHGISGAPVVDNQGNVVGVITRTDIFKVLISLSGLRHRGVQFAFEIEDRPGSIKELTDIIRAAGGRIASILGSYDRAPSGSRHVYIRAYGLDRTTIEDLKEALTKKAKMLYMVDHRENRREIFF
ncbi:CBS and ACT domain-containing protein [Desulfosoma sp.]|uniref:CBS and ACT domain-containing protein n=1 Tax=Desulfosoma sp. TaxID=2603217 RepID=UPI00404950EB